MAYQVIRQPEFDAAVANKLDKDFNIDFLLSGIKWTLEHNPYVGTKVSEHVWIGIVTIAPIVRKIYYTIDEERKRVYLMDLTS